MKQQVLTRLHRVLVLLALLTSAALPRVSSAQDGVTNPHGDFDPPLACSNCHTTNGWQELKPVLEFSHDDFPLLGRHQQVSCIGCHTELKFDEPEVGPSECATCHLDVHLGNFSQNCQNCHNNTSLNDVDGIALHEQSRFPLTGAHIQLACQNCHTDDQGGAFATMESECVSCHLADYENTTAIDHQAQGFPTQCESCHSTMSWGGTSFDHAEASGGFELLGAHAPLACENCHSIPDLGLLFQPSDNNDCVTCHQSDYDTEHQGSGFPTTCLTCHNSDSWEGTTFDHTEASGGFELLGAHAPLACENCHSMPDLGLLFQPSDNNDCVTCHQSDYDEQHQGSGFPTTCLTCHNTDTWGNTTFDHAEASGGFELLGAHAPLACENCHSMPDLGLLFQPSDNNDCVTCHQQDYDTEHQGSGFPTTCLTCHNTDTWGNTTFDHTEASGGFELLGAHAPLACENCHSMPDLGLLFQPSDNNDCVTCHQSDYDNEHQGSGFPTTCLTCHNTDTWGNTTFDHTEASGGFELVGAHAPLACENCHSMPDLGLLFQPSDNNDCVTCHQSDYDTEHQGSGFPTTCLTCHNSDSWEGTTFDHTEASGGFELLGAHAPLACENCHSMPDLGLLFQPSDNNDCVTCHQSDYDAEHQGSGFPTTCLTCHNTDSWGNTTFDHTEASGGFELLGAHAPLACENCHSMPDLGLLFQPSDNNDCVTCHQSDYDTEHQGSGFPTTCLTCHNTDTWGNTTFDHTEASGGFELLGAHAPLACENCHSMPDLGLLFQPSDNNDCVTCHQSDYDTEHQGSGFPTTCLTCHNTDTWGNTTFDHTEASGGFELVGAHAPLACENCHSMPDLGLLFQPSDNNDCVTCHQQDYDTEHQGSGFPTTCLTCHNTDTWGNTTFDHTEASGGFELLGAHAPLACENCHTMPDLGLLFQPSDNNDCVTCHQQDYDTEHQGSGFPTTCLTCHNTDTWGNTTFDHTEASGGFELLGAHAPLACENCHSMPDLGLLFQPSDNNDCVTCHQSDYDTEHQGSGFPTTCLTCHNTDTWGNTTFDHTEASGGFELLGAHAPLACENCHSMPDLGLLFQPSDNNDCVTCHQSDYDTEHQGSGFPTTCLTCHNTDTWGNTTFDHTEASGGFELLGAHAPLACENCHSMPDLGLLFQPSDNNDCVTCHQSDYDTEHQGSGFPTTCLTCHNTDTWGNTTFDHTEASGGFELLGAHAPLACENCHSMPDLALIFQPADNNDCITCHQQDYDAEHQGSGFPTTCLNCHSVDSWSNATFDHTAASGGFELLGAHAPLACENCHTMPDLGLIFQPADNNDCITCHQQDYNDEHQGSGFPTTCLNCHSVDSWDNATFDHTAASGGFELLGAHAPLACENCHTMPDLGLIFQPADNNDCITCHQQDYNDEHQGSGFPTTCLNCHSVDTWNGATFDHDGPYFPIYSGAHRGEWDSCQTCHDVPNDFAAFTCFNCHEHNQSQTNSDHRGVRNYVYESTACYNCHPRGRH